MKAFKILTMACLGLFLFSTSLNSQDYKVSLDGFINELQKSSGNTDKIVLVWWIPTKYWEVVLGEDPSITIDQIQEITYLVDQYTMVGVVDGDIGYFGGVTYTHADSIRNHLVLTDEDGRSYSPIANELVDADTKLLLEMMQPVLANMLGEMGNNFNFYLFPRVESIEKKLADPKADGKFDIQLFEEAFTWRLPLGSLLAPKMCPVDNEEHSGNWKFCPFHGKRLIEKS
jgi:hypothetical protein